MAGVAAAQSSEIRLQVVSQDAATPLDGRLNLRLRVTGPIGAEQALEIRVVARSRVEDFEGVVASANGELGDFKDAVELPLGALARFSNGDVVAGVVLQPRAEEQDFSKLQVVETGVYPLEVLVRDEEETVVAEAITWLVATDEASVPTVSFAWMWSLAAPPQVELDGVTPTDEFVAGVQPGTRLAATVDRLADADDLPITLDASPQTIEAWSRAADRDPDAATAFDALRAALSDGPHTLLAAPYVEIDAPALERSGLGPRVPDSYLDGARAVQQALGRRPDPSTVYLDPVDTASLARTADAFAYRAIVPFGSLADAGGVPREPFTIATPAGDFAALSTTDDLALLLEGPDLPGAKVQRFYAALAVVGAGRDARAVVVLAPPRDAAPNGGLVRALAAALRDQPLVEPTTAGRLFAADAGDERRSLKARTVTEPLIGAREVLAAEQTLATFSTLVGGDDPRVESGRATLRLVLAAGVPLEEHRRRLAAIGAAAEKFLAGIGTESKRVTLTDRRSAVPISFRNDTDRDVEVRVTLSSSKLSFPAGPSRVVSLPAGRNTTEDFTVEARTSGTFTMRVTIASVDGNLPVGDPTIITVRSAVFGSIGTWLTYGAVGFLALWWGHHLWQARRRRRSAGLPAGP